MYIHKHVYTCIMPAIYIDYSWKDGQEIDK